MDGPRGELACDFEPIRPPCNIGLGQAWHFIGPKTECPPCALSLRSLHQDLGLVREFLAPMLSSLLAVLRSPLRVPPPHRTVLYTLPHHHFQPGERVARFPPFSAPFCTILLFFFFLLLLLPLLLLDSVFDPVNHPGRAIIFRMFLSSPLSLFSFLAVVCVVALSVFPDFTRLHRATRTFTGQDTGMRRAC